MISVFLIFPETWNIERDKLLFYSIPPEVLLFSILLKFSYQKRALPFSLIITSEQVGADIVGLVIHLKSLPPAGFFAV